MLLFVNCSYRFNIRVPIFITKHNNNYNCKYNQKYMHNGVPRLDSISRLR